MTGLVVDPSATLRRILAHVLAGSGCENVIEAGDGTEALACLEGKEDEVGIVVTEWDLPGESGVELLKRVRERGETPVLLVTSRNSRRHVLEALQAGADGYVLKPISPEGLRTRIVQLLEGRKPDEGQEREAA